MTHRSDRELRQTRAMGKFIVWSAILIVMAFGAKWAVTEYWITTHCTMELGTRVCQ